jgi:WhiB family redox-sensing transcriptional regulator
MKPIRVPRITAIPVGDWILAAACRGKDPELWFPGPGGSVTEAKAICRHCDVLHECLAYALENNEQHGVYGGLTARERRRVPHYPRLATTSTRLVG